MSIMTDDIIFSANCYEIWNVSNTDVTPKSDVGPCVPVLIKSILKSPIMYPLAPLNLVNTQGSSELNPSKPPLVA